MHKPASVLENEAQTSLRFWDTDGSPDLNQTTRPNQHKKRICRTADFAAPANYRIKLKESEKTDKYLDLTRELQKLSNMKVMVIPTVIGPLGTVTKVLVQWLEDLEITGRVETIQTTALLRSVRILQRALETWGDLLSLKLQWKAIS